MSKRILKLNPGAQYDFVMNDHRHSAYMGGRGAGKTFASIVRGLRYSKQPTVPGEEPPVGMLLASTMPHLKLIVYPAFYKVAKLAGVKYKEVKNQTDRKFILLNGRPGDPGYGAEVLMRSLDDPDSVRGPNLAWFGIDEGRELDSDYAYKVLLATLRQGTYDADYDLEDDSPELWVPGQNYKHGGWVTSTPHGYDWMWRRFHPKSPFRKPNTEWYNAPTYDNKRNLPREYIRDLESDYEGKFYDQEVLGRFVGVISGAVFPEFDEEEHVGEVRYNPSLPLYAGWDFGIGDDGVVVFAQVDYNPKVLPDGSTIYMPRLYVIGSVSGNNMTTKQWAQTFWKWLDDNAEGRVPTAMWGDPSAQARSHTGTSQLQALAAEGVYVIPAPRKPVDEGLLILQNLMEGNRFLVNYEEEDYIRALRTYRWKVDDEGNKLSDTPIHDWTSHRADATRYLAIGVVGLHPRRELKPTEAAQRGTMQYIMDQLTNRVDEVNEMGYEDERLPGLDWHPDEQVGLKGLV